ncbi:ATP-binding protein [Brevundimonas sp.]|uniref:ATP-binding protein n=1 Tax=Brevundimonas sp. TaxID=1871086 RepID=UPI00289748AE|nr:ATP-binding protein [Brevundimonas sp.]
MMDEPRRPLIERFVADGHLRYWVITAWAAALLTEVDVRWVAAWYIVTMGFGFVRATFEHRALADPRLSRLRLARILVTVVCAAWAGAPFLAWFYGDDQGRVLAAILLCSGYMLVFTQMRSALKDAVIVSTPYTLVGFAMTVSLWGKAGFWTLLSAGPVLAVSLLIKVVVTRIRDREIAEAQARQDRLISDLEDARDQANAANDAKSAFLAVVSHELRTPLNGVLGAAQLLEMGALEGRQRDLVSVIRKSGDGLLVTLNDILDLTKVEAGKLELTPLPITLRELQDRLIGPFRSQAESKGLEFVVETSGELPAVLKLDALRAGQVVQNLLGNAIKFTASGRVTLSLGFERLGDATAALRVSVTDTGEGISAHDLERLFQPFTQVDASSTRRFGGTGLGLSIARKIASLFGGDVSVVSDVGRGSQFTFSATVEVLDWESDDALSADAIDLSNVAGAPLNVLVVEDHPVNLMLLQTWLGSMGHHCIAARDGIEALACCAETPFDLILMDINMPRMDGLTATHALRSKKGPNQGAAVVVLSASARMEDHTLGLAAGADAYLNKPIDFDALSDVVAQAAEGREAVGRPSRAA